MHGFSDASEHAYASVVYIQEKAESPHLSSMECYLSARWSVEWTNKKMDQRPVTRNCKSNITVKKPPHDEQNELLQKVHLFEDNYILVEEHQAEVINGFTGAALKKDYLAKDTASGMSKENGEEKANNSPDESGGSQRQP